MLYHKLIALFVSQALVRQCWATVLTDQMHDIVDVMQDAGTQLSRYVNRRIDAQNWSSSADVKLAFDTHELFFDWDVRNMENDRDDLEALEMEFTISAFWRLGLPYTAVNMFHRQDLMTALEPHMDAEWRTVCENEGQILRRLLVLQ